MYDIVLSKEICRLIAIDIYDTVVSEIRESEEKERKGGQKNNAKSN